jgi:DUF2934 family protein
MPRAKSPRNGNTTVKNGDASPEKVTSITQGFAPETKKGSSPADLQDQIRRRAYELYEQRGFVVGYEREDWLTAEREILARYNLQSA